MSEVKVAAIVGSLREKSLNRALLEATMKLAPSGMVIEHVEIRDIPVYNMDLEADFPEAVTQFKNRVKAADGLLIVTPEHNYSFPGVLKNALDWGSRPHGDGAFDNKPYILQSASPGWAGGIRAQMHLRQVMGYFEARPMYFPEVFVGMAHKKFDENMNLTDELSIGNITKQLAAFKDFLLKG